MELHSKSDLEKIREVLGSVVLDDQHQRLVESEIEGESFKDYAIRLVLTDVIEVLAFEDRLNASLVCREWHRVASPIIHKYKKLIRNEYVNYKHKWDENYKSYIVQSEIQNFIVNNSKYFKIIQQFELNYNYIVALPSMLMVQLSNITKLTLSRVKTYHDLVLNWLRPLKYLKVLKLNKIYIREISNEEELVPVDLPSTLKTLELWEIKYTEEPNGFQHTLQSHTNLDEFIFNLCDNPDLMDPFINNYPTLKEFTMIYGSSIWWLEEAIEIFLVNPQLTKFSFSTVDSYFNNSFPETYYMSQVSRPQKFEETITSALEPIEITESHLTYLNISLEYIWRELANTLLAFLSPKLTKLTISFNFRWNGFDSIFNHHYPQLIEMQFYFLNWDRDNILDIFEQFHKEWEVYLNHFKKLKILDFTNYSGHFNLNFFERFQSLEVIRFKNKINQEPKLASFWEHWDVEAENSELRQFGGWKLRYKIRYGRELYVLYRSNTQYSIDYLNDNF